MELYIPIERPNRNPINGQFLKGSKPHNKGKRMSDYLDAKTMGKIINAGRKNLRPNKNFGGHNKRAVVAFNEDGMVVGWFCSAEEASRKIGVTGSSIRNACLGYTKSSGGFKWEYEEKK